VIVLFAPSTTLTSEEQERLAREEAERQMREEEEAD